MRRTGDADGRRVVEGTDRDWMMRVRGVVCGQLGAEESQTTSHFIDATDFRHEGALKGIRLRVELSGEH